MMTKIAVCIGLSLLVLGSQAASENVDLTAFVAEGEAVIADFTKTFEGELISAIQSGGAVKAMDVCHAGAPKIATWLAGKQQATLTRENLKNKPLGKGLAWQIKVLQGFETSLTAGEPVEALVYKAIAGDTDAQEFRMMKAIPTGEVCLTCHGSKVTPNVYETLNMLHPTEGYSAREVRGAFVYVKSLNKKPFE